MVKSIRKPGDSTGEDALKTLETIYTIYKSAQQKGKRLRIK
jgi:hypothetical protein